MLGGIIGGAIGGAAKGLGELAEGQIADKRKMDLAKQMADLETEKQLMVDEVKRNRDVTDIGRKSEAETTAADKRRGALIESDKKFGPQEAANAAAQKKNQADAEVNGGVAAAEAARDKAKFDAGKGQRDAELNEKLTNLGNPKYIKALSAEARAKHVDSVAEVARANATNYELGERKKVDKLIGELEDPETKPDRVAAITRSLIARGVMKGGGEYEAEKVTTTTDPDGNVIERKTEATQRRRPGTGGNGGSAAPASTGPWNQYQSAPAGTPTH